MPGEDGVVEGTLGDGFVVDCGGVGVVEFGVGVDGLLVVCGGIVGEVGCEYVAGLYLEG